MSKPEHRHAAGPHGLRYPSDLSDAEWVLVEPIDSTGQAWRPAAGREIRRAKRLHVGRHSTNSNSNGLRSNKKSPRSMRNSMSQLEFRWHAISSFQKTARASWSN